MVLPIVRRFPVRVLLRTISRSLSSFGSDNLSIAKNLIDHIETLDSRAPNYFLLKTFREKVKDLTEEHAELSKIDPKDELASIAQEECREINTKLEQMIKESSILLDSMSKYDTQDAYFEIFAGAGGLEAGVFAGELLNLYQGYMSDHGFEYNVEESEKIPASSVVKALAAQPINRAKLSVRGQNVFKTLKHECGVHRVQRVPYTGSKSDRLQTSTCSISVVPQPKDFNLNEKDLKFDYMFASGPGGQNVNKNQTKVRLLHVPTGIFVHCQESREQHKNKQGAIKLLKAVLYQKQFEGDLDASTKLKKSQIGNMDRTEKIRSYNFQRNHISDHRLGEVKQVSNIGQFLQGSFGFSVLEEFKKKLDELNAIESLKSYLLKNKSNAS